MSKLLFMLMALFSHAAIQAQDTLPYDEIYAYGMDANVKPVLDLLQEQNELNQEDEDFKVSFLNRFGGTSDLDTYERSGDEQIDQLLGYFRNYWRLSLLDAANDHMMDLGRQVMPFLMEQYPAFKGPQQRDSLGYYLAQYIKSRGFYTTDRINPQGRLVDLQIWKSQTDSVFQVRLDKSQEISVRVVMMNDFVTLGWMEYATLGKHHPGGWTTEDALYCVEDAYDYDSEHFTVSYLAHEARHFADKQVYDELTDQQLEYRAKLTELSHARKSSYHLIEFFITNANAESVNGHQLANHQLISNLSEQLFNLEYQSAIEEWERVPVKKINRIAAQLLAQDTRSLETQSETISGQ